MIGSALQALHQLAHVPSAAPVQEALGGAWKWLGVTNLREAVELAAAMIVVGGGAYTLVDRLFKKNLISQLLVLGGHPPVGDQASASSKKNLIPRSRAIAQIETSAPASMIFMWDPDRFAPENLNRLITPA